MSSLSAFFASPVPTQTVAADGRLIARGGEQLDQFFAGAARTGTSTGPRAATNAVGPVLLPPAAAAAGAAAAARAPPGWPAAAAPSPAPTRTAARGEPLGGRGLLPTLHAAMASPGAAPAAATAAAGAAAAARAPPGGPAAATPSPAPPRTAAPKVPLGGRGLLPTFRAATASPGAAPAGTRRVRAAHTPAGAQAPAKPHPTYEERRSALLSDDSLRAAILGEHNCSNRRADGKSCHHGLWGDVSTAVGNLRRQRQRVLPIVGDSSGAARRELLLNQLILSNPQAQGTKEVRYFIGGQRVCQSVFLDHWCVSKAQFFRYVHMVKEFGASAVEKARDGSSAGYVNRDAGGARHKRDFVISWIIEYALEVTEQLPDCPKVCLPRQAWADLFAEFAFDMEDAKTSEHLCSQEHFRQTFHEAKELEDYEMTTHKRNFGKCATCVRDTERQCVEKEVRVGPVPTLGPRTASAPWLLPGGAAIRSCCHCPPRPRWTPHARRTTPTACAPPRRGERTTTSWCAPRSSTTTNTAGSRARPRRSRSR